MYFQNARNHMEHSPENDAVAANISHDSQQATDPSGQEPCDQAGNDILSGWLTTTLVQNIIILVKYYIIYPFQSFCNVGTC